MVMPVFSWYYRDFFIHEGDIFVVFLSFTNSSPISPKHKLVYSWGTAGDINYKKDINYKNIDIIKKIEIRRIK
jgi:hypothetical protein